MFTDSPISRALPGGKVVMPTADELVDRIGADLLRIANHTYIERGVFHMALSGGSTPLVLYRRLMIDPTYRLFPWRATHLWVVDDRCVPRTDDRSNWKMLKELIVDHAGIPDQQVHPMPVLDRGGDRKYENELKSRLQTPQAGGRLDYVLLGMGPDGHTASLFPETEGLKEQSRWVIFNDGEKVIAPRPRMTMTYPLINNARHIHLLVTGQNKFPTLQRVAASPRDVTNLPVTGIAPLKEDATMTWYFDQAAITGANP